MKVFTFLSKEEIEDTMQKHLEKPEERYAQKVLAKEIITDLHGKEECDKAIRISQALFNGKIKNLNSNEIFEVFKGVPTFQATKNNIIDFLVDGKIASSKREAREFVTAGSITINDEKITDQEYFIDENIAIDGVLVVRRGKKKYFIGHLNNKL